MPLSFQQHTANGSTTVFSAAQIDGYLSVNDIYVYVNDNLKIAGLHYSLQTSPSLQVTFLPGNTPAFKDEVRIQRITPKTTLDRVVDFADGSVLNANDLDQSALQLLYIAQEAEDFGSGALGKQFDQFSWNAENLPITSLATSGASDSAATKGYVDNLALYGGGAINPQSWTFSGDAVQTDFALSPVANATNPAMFIVEVAGTILRPTTDYTFPTASLLQFTNAPASGTNNIRVRNFGVSRNLNESVSTAMIQDLNVTTGKIANGAVTSAKLASSLAITTELTVGGQTVGPKGPATNTVLGTSAGASNVSGVGNTFVGSSAGNTATGDFNTLIGAEAGTGSGISDAVAIGRAAKAGSMCVAAGNYALNSGSAVAENVAIGHAALINASAGANTALGCFSGASITTGTSNVMIGRNSQPLAAGNSNSIVIGTNAVGAGSNTTTIGNSSTTRTIIPAGTLEVAGQATFGSVGQSLINKQFSDSAAAGTSIQASFPTWTRRVFISLAAVSTNGTNPLFVRVVRGGIHETANYASRVHHHGVGWGTVSNGFQVTGNLTAANNYSGTLVFDRIDSAGTIWVLSGQVMDQVANAQFSLNGYYSGGSTAIDGIQIFPGGGQSFDGTGRIAISWE